MADEHEPAAPHPQPPAGMQRPGVPGAGNILDPAVRADLREQLHAALHGAMPGGGAPAAEEEPAEEENESAEPAPPRYRSGPYPHGDVDLRFISANVPAERPRPRRGGAGRRFYFLNEPATPAAGANAPAAQPPDGPKPG